MSAPLVDVLARIGSLSPAEVRQEWERVFKRPLPINFSPDLLRRSLAHHVQERCSGGSNKATQRRISRMLEVQGSASELGALQLRPGTRLAREWQGTTHHVLVTKTGFEYREQTYRSLSGIARTITGAAWSGPRFFGLLPNQRGGNRAQR